jgi:ribonuclease D
LTAVVASHTALSELVDRLAQSDTVALDTEFLRERTYRAELCLVQVSDGRHAACVDPLALRGLGDLGGVLSNSSRTKVMHAARQDLEVLLPLTGVLAPVWDTQTAAGLAGFPAQVGYAELVLRLLGIELTKGQTRTDWSRRPLNPAQLEYALDDVRYLLPLRETLAEKLERLGRSAWLAEDLAQAFSAQGLVADPEQSWKRVKGLGPLDPGRIALARSLAAWRERRASERNRPRGWILDDQVLRGIVHTVPRSMNALAAIEQIPAGVVSHSGEELIALIHASGVEDPPPPLPPRERPDPLLAACVKKLGARTQTVAREFAIAPELLATRRDLEDLARGERDLAVLRGWRRAILGERLLNDL